jgi:uncharacterized protein
MSPRTCTAFAGHRRIASGATPEIARTVRSFVETGSTAQILVFDDSTGAIVDMDFRDPAQMAGVSRPSPELADGSTLEHRGRGRPKLGVVAREITLLPRHWDWLNGQPGGASVALRKLVEQARREHARNDSKRNAREAGYRFMSAMAGDFPNFEEASRALFGDDRENFNRCIENWPQDVAEYAVRLAFDVAA